MPQRRLQREEYIHIINEQIERINGIVLTMLELSRLESGKIELNNYHVSLSELVEEVIDDFEYELEKKRLHIVKNMKKWFWIVILFR